jgi:hypothetical protein
MEGFRFWPYPKRIVIGQVGITQTQLTVHVISTQSSLVVLAWNVYSVVRMSLLKTLAHKHKQSVTMMA